MTDDVIGTMVPAALTGMRSNISRHRTALLLLTTGSSLLSRIVRSGCDLGGSARDAAFYAVQQNEKVGY